MKPENLDRMLGGEDELVPSSGFASSVMERIREEAAEPEPIPFPWKRALPGMIPVAAGLVWCVVQLVRMGIVVAESPALMRVPPPALLMTIHFESAGWVTAALAMSLLSWLLARRIVGRRGLV